MTPLPTRNPDGPSYFGWLPLGEEEISLSRSGRLTSGRFLVEEDKSYLVNLKCRINAPLNSEVIHFGDVETGPLDVESAPSVIYRTGFKAEVRNSSLRFQDHTPWLEMETLDLVPSFDSYEEARGASLEKALKALRDLRGSEVTEKALIRSRIREFYLTTTLSIQIPNGMRSMLTRQRQKALSALFVSPQLRGEGMRLSIHASEDHQRLELEAADGEDCARFALRPGQLMDHLAP